MKAASAIRLLVVAVALPSVLAPAVALAGTSYQTNLVPYAESGFDFSANGSSIKIVSSGKLRIKGKLKRVVYDSGERVTSGDKYAVVVYCFIPALKTDTCDAIVTSPPIEFELKNGNGTFKDTIDLQACGEKVNSGHAVVVQEVRVLDSMDKLIGYGGVLKK